MYVGPKLCMYVMERVARMYECMWVFVCVYVYMCGCVYACMSNVMHVCNEVNSTTASVSVCVYGCMCVCVYVCTSICMYVRSYALM